MEKTENLNDKGVELDLMMHNLIQSNYLCLHVQMTFAYFVAFLLNKQNHWNGDHQTLTMHASIKCVEFAIISLQMGALPNVTTR